MVVDEFEKHYQMLAWPAQLALSRQFIKDNISTDLFIFLMDNGWTYLKSLEIKAIYNFVHKVIELKGKLTILYRKLTTDEKKIYIYLFKIFTVELSNTNVPKIIQFLETMPNDNLENVVQYYFKNIPKLTEIGVSDENIKIVTRLANKDTAAENEAISKTIIRPPSQKNQIWWITLFIFALLFFVVIFFFLAINIVLYIIIWINMGHRPPWFVAFAALFGNFMGTIYLLLLF